MHGTSLVRTHQLNTTVHREVGQIAALRVAECHPDLDALFQQDLGLDPLSAATAGGLPVPWGEAAVFQRIGSNGGGKGCLLDHRVVCIGTMAGCVSGRAAGSALQAPSPPAQKPLNKRELG